MRCVRSRAASVAESLPDLRQELRHPLAPVGEPQEAGVVGSALGHVQDAAGLKEPELPEGVGVAGDVPVDVGPHASRVTVDVEDDGDHVGGLQDLCDVFGLCHGRTPSGCGGCWKSRKVPPRPLPRGGVCCLGCCELRSLNAGADVLVCSRYPLRSTLSLCSLSVPSAPHQPDGDDDRHDDDQDHEDDQEVVCEAHSVR